VASAFGGQRSIQLSYGCLGHAPSKAAGGAPVAFRRGAQVARFALGAGVLGLYAHRSATGQRQHSGVRALQM
jgi:hypothetical protein